MQLRAMSKTVRERQLRRLKPRHYEILIRYLHGQTLREISSEMGLGEQRLSVIINSPLFQEELRGRLREQEEEIVRRIVEQDMKRIGGSAAMRRSIGGSAIEI